MAELDYRYACLEASKDLPIPAVGVWVYLTWPFLVNIFVGTCFIGLRLGSIERLRPGGFPIPKIGFSIYRIDGGMHSSLFLWRRRWNA